MLLGVAASAMHHATRGGSRRSHARATAGDCAMPRTASGAPASGQLARRWVRVGLWLAMLGAAGIAASRTVARNRDWSSPDAITNSTARACPGSAKAMLSLGTMHLTRKQHAAAHDAFRAALRIHPTYCDALQWLGRLAFMEGRLKDAEQLLQVCRRLDPLLCVLPCGPSLADDLALADCCCARCLMLCTHTRAGDARFRRVPPSRRRR